MKQDVVCVICNQTLGKVHGYQEAGIRANHIKNEHPTIYQEIAQTSKEVQRIWKVYKVHWMDLFYYKGG